MNWNPVTKQITDLQIIQVQQTLEQEGDGLSFPSPFVFTWADLVESFARTATIKSAVPDLSQEERKGLAHAIGVGNAEEMNLFVDVLSAEFSITTRIGILADVKLTSLAADIGAAIADLAMERLGFHWRANMREIKFDPPEDTADLKKRIPDFVYDSGGANGFRLKNVVVVEAKGSLSKTGAKRASIRRRAEDAYDGQVQHIIGRKSHEVVVAGGYAIAFGAIPGGHVGAAASKQASTLAIATPQLINIGASTPVKANPLSAAATYGGQQVRRLREQESPRQRQQHEELRKQKFQEKQRGTGGPRGPTGGGPRREEERLNPTGRVAYANYEYAFLLCGADNAAGFIRGILNEQSVADIDPERLVQDFWIFDRGGKRFWMGLPRPRPWWPGWWPEPGLFGIYDTSAKEILESVSSNQESVPAFVPLTVAPTSDGPESDRDPDIALQGDGLALLRFRSPPIDHRLWDLRKGDWI